MKVGVLAIQGDFEAHAHVLERLGVEWRYVRQVADLAGLDGLILPGGESTTHLKFFDEESFAEAICKFHAEGKHLFGTCAGAILLAREVTGPAQASLGLVDISIERNAYGRQVVSGVRQGESVLTNGPVEMVFIRAPIIRRVGQGVNVLGECEGLPVAVEQSRCLLTTFHPELTSDTTFHEYFLSRLRNGR
ncbi:MAG: pyridoxal 5'-phosphate synthase glutaminase subunit PdxT [Acidobacteria bacterium]|nr:pyridoxal 5'-phosphate synthase glutaminase subunit PdxT [Acidobacteriota bacterium]